MNFLGLYPIPNLLEESWREVERERELRRQIQEARDARRAMRQSRFAALAARVRDALRHEPGAPVAEGC